MQMSVNPNTIPRQLDQELNSSIQGEERTNR